MVGFLFVSFVFEFVAASLYECGDSVEKMSRVGVGQGIVYCCCMNVYGVGSVGDESLSGGDGSKEGHCTYMHTCYKLYPSGIQLFGVQNIVGDGMVRRVRCAFYPVDDRYMIDIHFNRIHVPVVSGSRSRYTE